MYTIYGKPDCPWCDKAREALKLCPYGYIDVMKDEQAQALFRKLSLKTVPQVFLGHTLIGGFEDLEAHLESL